MEVLLKAKAINKRKKKEDPHGLEEIYKFQDIYPQKLSDMRKVTCVYVRVCVCVCVCVCACVCVCVD